MDDFFEEYEPIAKLPEGRFADIFDSDWFDAAEIIELEDPEVLDTFL